MAAHPTDRSRTESLSEESAREPVSQRRRSETRLRASAPIASPDVGGVQTVQSTSHRGSTATGSCPAGSEPLAGRAKLWLVDVWLREAVTPAQLAPGDAAQAEVGGPNSAIVPAVSSSDDGPQGTGVHNTRRAGGARREASSRVTLRRFGPDGPTGEGIVGWTLNISRGGVRVVVEEMFEENEELLVTVGDGDEAQTHHARVAWVRDEADGQIIGVQYLDVEGTIPPPEVS